MGWHYCHLKLDNDASLQSGLKCRPRFRLPGAANCSQNCELLPIFWTGSGELLSVPVGRFRSGYADQCCPSLFILMHDHPAGKGLCETERCHFGSATSFRLTFRHSGAHRDQRGAGVCVTGLPILALHLFSGASLDRGGRSVSATWRDGNLTRPSCAAAAFRSIHHLGINLPARVTRSV